MKQVKTSFSSVSEQKVLRGTHLKGWTNSQRLAALAAQAEGVTVGGGCVLSLEREKCYE